MKISTLTVSFFVLILGSFCYSDRLKNGNFEEGTVGQLPQFWTYTGGEGGISINVSKVSPFMNVYFAQSQKSIYLTDSIFTHSIPRLSQSFIESQTGELKLRFDFYVDGSGHFWRVCVGNFDMSSVVAEFNVGASFQVNGRQQIGITQRVWYQVETVLDIASGLQNGRLSRWDNGVAVAVSEWSQVLPPANFNPDDSVNTLWLADSQTNPSSMAPPTYFDNVSILLTFCGDTGTYYFIGDRAGSGGVGDAFRDCKVDIFDVLAFAEYWLSTGL